MCETVAARRGARRTKSPDRTLVPSPAGVRPTSSGRAIFPCNETHSCASLCALHPEHRRNRGPSVRYTRARVLKTLATFATVALLVQQPALAQTRQTGNPDDSRRIRVSATTRDAVLESNGLIVRVLQRGELTSVRVQDDPQIAGRQTQTLQQ